MCPKQKTLGDIVGATNGRPAVISCEFSGSIGKFVICPFRASNARPYILYRLILCSIIICWRGSAPKAPFTQGSLLGAAAPVREK